MTYTDEIAATTPGMIALRRDIHANPEIEFQESRTAAIIAERLATAGLDVEEGIGGTGVAGVLKGDSDGPTPMSGPISTRCLWLSKPDCHSLRT